ncbi:SDR family NAD(P)-dependent oxidoreductase [Halorussus salinisoli]|uniref:SDR family NAD(P)-dependent oxidoreductase n=1 Tax=Halorussus salinisoli TaxID=2558242 RepID=UPI0010C22728|nr:SDR family oxidoreductase [Halorussus salinisoli]
MTATQRTAEHNRTALITGASWGIGHELTKLFTSDGYDVVLVARSQDRLEQICAELEDAHNITATVIAKDLSVPGAAEELYEAVSAEDIHVDTLVNNAGFAIYGRFSETDLERVRELVQLNLVTVTELTRLFVRPMCERGEGQILNVSSLAGMYPIPKAAIYAATKSYVLSFSVALANELAEDGITVSVLCPGETDTSVLKRGGLQHSALPEKDLLDPETVAKTGYNGLQQGQTVVVPGGIKEKLRHHLPRILPKTRVAATAKDYWEKE